MHSNMNCTLVGDAPRAARQQSPSASLAQHAPLALVRTQPLDEHVVHKDGLCIFGGAAILERPELQWLNAGGERLLARRRRARRHGRQRDGF